MRSSKKILKNKVHCLLFMNQQINMALTSCSYDCSMWRWSQDIPYRISNLAAPCKICIHHSTLKKIIVLTEMSRHSTVITYLGHCILPMTCQIWKACIAVLCVRHCLWLYYVPQEFKEIMSLERISAPTINYMIYINVKFDKSGYGAF